MSTTFFARLDRACRAYGFWGVLRNVISDGYRIAYIAFYHGRIATRLMLRRWSGAVGLDPGIRHKLSGVARARLSATLSAGYAVRGLVYLPRDDRTGLLVSADVGDDCLTLRELDGGRPCKRRRLRFPKSSAPLALAQWNQGRDLLATTFNFDQTNAAVDRSCIWHFRGKEWPLSDRPGGGQVHRLPDPVLSRDGHCGFRGIAVHTDTRGMHYVGVTDRDRHCLYLACIPADQEALSVHDFVCLDLREHSADKIEPVGVSIVPSPHPIFCISSRKRPQLLVVRWPSDRAPIVSQRVELKGLSRSSIAVGRVGSEQGWNVAVALWGGDPEDIDSPHAGEVAVFHCNASGTLSAVATMLPAGTNATDVVMGDFDGDGRDELAVLSYGVGLNHFSRAEEGDVRIYKWIADSWELAWEVSVPHPRIGLAADVDGDGQLELVVSLFFADRLVVLDFAGPVKSSRARA